MGEGAVEEPRMWVPPKSMVRCKMVQYIGLNLAKLQTMTWLGLGNTSGSINFNA